ncbi:hypothetical protein ACQ4M3_08730 [Leptolyngbya sp. AN03gr2]|uniref:hypothetical protein n=1 Tax=unclassified Leptolyngbya TaxID=2650499 RepID=UPI003D314638
MRGRFGERGELYFEIELISADGDVLVIEALFDTGFTGWVALNRQDAQSLGWLEVDTVLMDTARGLASFSTYVEQIQFSGQEREIEILGGEDVTEVLMGVAWLQTGRLVADLAQGLLTLGD